MLFQQIAKCFDDSVSSLVFDVLIQVLHDLADIVVVLAKIGRILDQVAVFGLDFVNFAIAIPLIRVFGVHVFLIEDVVVFDFRFECLLLHSLIVDTRNHNGFLPGRADATPCSRLPIGIVDGPANGAYDGFAVQVIETGAATVAGSLRAPFSFCQPCSSRSCQRPLPPANCQFCVVVSKPKNNGLRANNHPGSRSMKPMISHPAGPLAGTVAVPGDKSISHRALILGACAVGETSITGLLEAEDVLATAEAMRRLGAEVNRGDDRWQVFGRGVGGLAEPDSVLDMGNSGTGARLVIGLVASHPFITFFSGDASLSARPMNRVIEPLRRAGASFWSRSGGRLPLAVRGAENPLPIVYTLPVASAQVKSAILLAALNAPGKTTVVEPQPTRDHTEAMLSHFGAEVETETLADGGRRITLVGQPELTGREVVVPGDISSAAFPLVAASLVPKSRVTLRNVGINPLRTGLLETLGDMGARISVTDRRVQAGEPVADLLVEASPLNGVEVPAGRVPAMIDEFPVLAAAAACATGTTRMHGLAELRVKESDRLAAMAHGLEACGVRVEMGEDWLFVDGDGGAPPGGGQVTTNMDHRIAMAFLVLGMASRAPVRIDDAEPIATSFPSFMTLMNGLGAHIEDASAD